MFGTRLARLTPCCRNALVSALVLQPAAGLTRNPQRHFSSSYTTSEPLDLAYDLYSASSSSSKREKAPVVVLHGLYGSRQNWRSLAKAMSKKLQRDIFTLDLRNHGTSPHSPNATYSDLAADVGYFMDSKGLKDVILLGHSMGGKVAMALALQPHDAIEKLIVVDIAPGVGKISPEFKTYLDAMKEIDLAKVHSRKEADEILTKYEPELSTRQFLLTNLDRTDPTGPYKFRLPLDYLYGAIEEIGNFPYAPGERTFEKPTLVLKGAKSKYINRRNIPLIKAYFPKMELKELDAGHWVHVEQPNVFLDYLADFCESAGN